MFACVLLLQQQRSMAPSRPLTWMEFESAPKKADKTKEDQTRQKVVQSNSGNVTDKAAPDSFLGEKTRVVDLQTVSSKKATEMGSKPVPAKNLTKAESQKVAKAQAKTEKTAERANELSKLGLAILPVARRPSYADAFAQDAPQWANIGSQPQDYVNGIKESDRTALNTREYIFFGYHQRIRQRLELEWTRLLRVTLTKYYRNGRQLASETEYTTKLMVILNDHGEITRVKVLSISGAQELDDVAVQAFNRAGPFPNPPRGLVKNGEIEVPWEMKLRS